MDRRLLIVDDEDAILNLLKTLFTENSDWQVTTATSGKEAMSILFKKRFPLIITDLKMPHMNGVELCSRIRETNPLSYIIAMTGYQDFFELKNCREIGFDDYFKKPFEFTELLEQVESAYKKMTRWEKILTS